MLLAEGGLDVEVSNRCSCLQSGPLTMMLMMLMKLHPLLLQVSTSLSWVHDEMLCMELERLCDMRMRMRMQEIWSALLGPSWTDKQSIEWLLLGKMEDGGETEKAGRFVQPSLFPRTRTSNIKHQTLAPRKAPGSVKKRGFIFIRSRVSYGGSYLIDFS